MSKVVSLAICLVIYVQGSAQTDLLFTDFQSGIPSNYTMINNDGYTPNAQVAEYTDAWISKVDPADPMNFTASSTSYFTPVGKADRWLITDALTLGNYGNFISWSAKSHDASFPDGYRVLVSTASNQISDFIDTIGNIQGEYTDWTSRSVDLSNKGYDNQTIYVAFVNNTNNGYKLYLDSIHVWKEDPVGVIESSSYELSIYPNPFTDEVKVKSELMISKLELLDLNGKLHLTVANQNTINTSTLPKGVYFVRIYTESELIVRRLIKN